MHFLLKGFDGVSDISQEVRAGMFRVQDLELSRTYELTLTLSSNIYPTHQQGWCSTTRAGDARPGLGCHETRSEEMGKIGISV